MAKVFNNENFESDVKKSDKLTVVDFWAEWCGPCRMLGPIVEELSNDFEGRANIGKLNVDENPDVAAEFGVRSIPTTLFFKDGELVDKLVGVADKATFAQKVEALL